MKKTVLACVMVACVNGAWAQTDFYSNVTNLWWQGYKTNVLVIANARLAQNTNDIAGLLLKLEYDFEFINVNEISNDVQRVIAVGATVTTPNFQEQYGSLSQSLDTFLDYLTSYPASAIPEDRAKALIPHKPMTHEMPLEALQKDGYFD
jgi:hypothetical protein